METEQQTVAPTRVVVGTDLSLAARYALDLATELVRPAGVAAELHVAHVTPTASFIYPPIETRLGPAPDVYARADETRRELAELCFELDKATKASVILHATLGDPVFEIERVAQSVGADLIVVGARHRHGFRWHRSVAARLARRAACSVLVARPKDPQLESMIEPVCEDCLAIRRATGGSVEWCSRHGRPPVATHLHQGATEQLATESWTFRT